jgi:hypothetical protein
LRYSGRLRITVAPEEVLKKFAKAGFVNAAVIGGMREGKARLAVR